jgi:hypothetical protein
MQGFSGSLSDKLQKREAIALAGYLLAAIAKPLIGLSIVWQGVSGARVFSQARAPFAPGRDEAVLRGQFPQGRRVRSPRRHGAAMLARCVGKLGRGEVIFY